MDFQEIQDKLFAIAYEQSRNPFQERKSNILGFVRKYASVIVDSDKIGEIKLLAQPIMETGIKRLAVRVDMNTAETLSRGMECLTEGLGIVGAERFISVVLREQADYTKWRQEHYDSMDDGEIERDMDQFAQNHPKAFE